MNILLISGSLRRGSTNTALLRTARALMPDEVTTTLYEDLAALPYFDPDLDHDPLPGQVEQIRSAVHRADAILFCTPEYAGALPGAFKNGLEWMIGDAEPRSISGKPVAWINISAAPTSARDAHDSLRKVLTYAGAKILEGAELPVHRHMIDDDGLITDAEVRAGIVEVMNVLLRSGGR